MAAGTMATAAGAAVVLYYVLSRRLARKRIDDEDPDGDLSKSSRSVRRNRLARRPAQAPATLLESIVTLTETLRFTYTETLGKWPIGDLAFSINYFMRKQGNLPVASVYAGNDCKEKQRTIIGKGLIYRKGLGRDTDDALTQLRVASPSFFPLTRPDAVSLGVNEL